MLYAEFSELYRFNYQDRTWVKRKRNTPVIARVQAIPVQNEELFAMRALLMVKKSPISFDDLKGDSETYFEEACKLGLIESSEFWDNYLNEVVQYAKRPKDGYHRNPSQSESLLLEISRSDVRPEFLSDSSSRWQNWAVRP
ncbi:hypothetical protein L596_006623 [Steinernema carpocapsae]|uniref:Uncharacterized protein n=1 Tax=Steinernema carpocapsae TaxID=34508 RepID=A0A4U8V2M8_STECR|nr:hypothetical protein L596_006623 [Steinernema carpocapsae]